MKLIINFLDLIFSIAYSDLPYFILYNISSLVNSKLFPFSLIHITWIDKTLPVITFTYYKRNKRRDINIYNIKKDIKI